MHFLKDAGKVFLTQILFLETVKINFNLIIIRCGTFISKTARYNKSVTVTNLSSAEFQFCK